METITDELYESGSAVPTTPAHPVGLDTWEGIIRRAPGLINAYYRLLLAWTLFSNYVLQNEGKGGRVFEYVAIPAGRLAQLQGRELEYEKKRFVGRDFLEGYRAVFLDFDWTGWQIGLWPRQVRSDGVPDDLYDLLMGDLLIPLPELGPAVDLGTGDPVPDPFHGRGTRVRREARERAEELAAERRKHPMCDEQGVLLDLLNGVPSNVVAGIVNRNAGSAAQASLSVQPKPGVISSLRYPLRAAMDLRRLQYQPFSPYVPSYKRRTVRVFPASYPSVVSLRRGVRNQVLSGCLAFDLKNAQLACAARVWGVPPLLDLLEREGTAWPYLLDIVRGHHGLTDGEAKVALKGAIYSCVFGMVMHGVSWRLTVALSAEAAAAFMADPVVQALFERRERALAEIEAQGGARDCFGVWYPLRDGMDRDAECRSALAATMQAEELRLLLPVVEDAVRVSTHSRPQYRVTGWLHDGFYVKARTDAEGLVRRLQGAVEREANRLGIPTGLDVEYL